MEATDLRYEPFKRHDLYGDMGRGPLSIPRRLRLYVLAVLVFPLRCITTVGCLACYNVLCRLSFLVPSAYRVAWIVFWGRVLCRLCLFCLGFVRVEWITFPSPTPAPKVGGVVSNHLSWCDILIHMSRSFPSFVARVGTEKLPFVGLISQLMQCIYVQRENKTSETKGVSALVKERMQVVAKGGTTDRPMLLFPEGTTTNNRYLLPFKTGAFLAAVPVQPVLVKYHEGAVSCCWESMPALKHLFLMMCEPFHGVTCYELPVYVPSLEEQQDPVLYANNVREYMLRYGSQLFGLKPIDSGLEWKRKYHELLLGESKKKS